MSMKYTDEQIEFINADVDRLILNAPAGAGKTETVAERVRRGVEGGKNVRVLCFTNSARETISARLMSVGLDVDVRTIHSFAHEVLSAHYGRSFVSGDGQDLAMDVAARSGIDWRDVLLLEGLNANGAPLPSSMPAGVVEVYKRYEQKKKDQGYLSFSELVVAATGLGVEPIDELIVDEAQDVSPSQMRFLAELGAASMVLVGDPLQAIYGFAGVDPDLFSKLLAAGWTEVALTRSYRVPEGVLPAVNAVRGVPLSAVRSGGSVGSLVVSEGYAGVLDALMPELRPGDAVLGLTRRQLDRVASGVELLTGLDVSRSWLDGKKEGSVFFSTVYAAKGGEWDRVWILDVAENGLYSANPLMPGDAERLFYVAASRAKSDLRLVQIGEELPYGLGGL